MAAQKTAAPRKRAPKKTEESNPLSVGSFTAKGESSGQYELPESIFGVTPNQAVMHQAYLRQLANARQGTADTKTRGEVSGGGAKPYRQKGTGRARHGSMTVRQPGSIGATDAARVFKGVRMAGQMGNVKTTVQGLKVLRIDGDRNLLLIAGAVPGPRGQVVLVRGSLKVARRAARAAAKGGR